MPLPALDTRICAAFVADAERDPEDPKWWFGVWAVPGLCLAFVRSPPDGPICRYVSHHEAKCAALAAGYHHLNRRTVNVKGVYERMDAPTFAADLAATGLGPVDFARLWGTESGRVESWMKGKEDIPFPMWWTLEALQDSRFREIALEIVAPKFRPKGE